MNCLYQIFFARQLNKTSRYCHDTGVVVVCVGICVCAGVGLTNFNLGYISGLTADILLKPGRYVLYQKSILYHQGRYISVHFCKNYALFLVPYWTKGTLGLHSVHLSVHPSVYWSCLVFKLVTQWSLISALPNNCITGPSWYMLKILYQTLIKNIKNQ